MKKLKAFFLKKSKLRKIKSSGKKRRLATAILLSLRLLFGGSQLASANPNSFQNRGNSQPKTEISRVLEQKSPSMRDFNQEGSTQPEQVLKGTQGAQTALKIPSGGSPSSRPTSAGSKAKADAKRDFARRQTGKKPTSGKSSGSISAEAFSLNIIHGSRPTPLPGNFNIPRFKSPSGRHPAKLNPDQFHLNQDDRFDKLSKNPSTNQVDKKSRTEAITILQAEKEGLVINPRRPNLKNADPDLDFIIDGPEPYKYVDVKNPIDPRKYPSSKKKPESFNKMATRMGAKIRKQKGGSNDVLHIVDLEKLPSEIKAKFIEKVIEGAVRPNGIEFININ